MKLLTEDYDLVINKSNITISMSIKEFNTCVAGIGCNSSSDMRYIANKYKFEILTSTEIDIFYSKLKEIAIKLKET